VLHYVRGCSYDNTCFILGLDVDAIQINPRRHLDEKKLRQLKASIAQIGLQTPITVRLKGKKAVLVAGLHRLVAMKELGERSIPCFEHNREENESYLWQRSENLYRAELRVLERAEAIDEMRQLIQQWASCPSRGPSAKGYRHQKGGKSTWSNERGSTPGKSHCRYYRRGESPGPRAWA